MRPFVLAETKFPSFSANSVSSFLSPSTIGDERNTISKEREREPTTPASTTTSGTSTSSLEDLGDAEDHTVEVIHSSPGRRSYHYQKYKHQNDLRTTTITSTRCRNGHYGEIQLDGNCNNMSLQLDRYGFITNIDAKGHILETNGAESIKVPSFSESQRTERREKKWKATLQTWDKQNKQSNVAKRIVSGIQSKPTSQNVSKQIEGRLSSPSKIKQEEILKQKPLPRQAQFASNKLIIRRLRKGIPDSMRGQTWVSLGGGIRVPGMYQQIVQITTDALLKNCRELQQVNKYRKEQQQEHSLLESHSGSFPSDGYASTNAGGGDHTPERVGIESNSTSNRTSPTSAASEVSSLANTSPNKTAKSPSGPTLPTRDISEKEIHAPSKEKTKENYASSRGFRSIQDVIERDIHRTYPRHNLFYEEERSIPMDGGNDGSHLDGTDTGSNLSAGSNGTPTSMCDPELAALILNLEMDLRIASAMGDKNNSDSAVVGLQQYSIHDSNNHCTIQATTQRGQAALRRVLRAYSYYDPEVGYCQGMNFIAGMFLTLTTEEEAFWLLVSVMSDKPCHMRGLFGEGMLHTHKVLYVAEKLIYHHLSRLARHFEKEHVHVTMYATQWLLTQYTSSFKFDLVVRVWDAFLGEGWKIIYRIMLALLQKYQSQLLKMSFEEILTFFRELPDRVEGGQIMDMALKIPLRRKVIAKYEREWEAKEKQKQQD